MSHCPTCHEYIGTGPTRHHCKPLFYCYTDLDDQDVFEEIRANCPSEAAEKYAELDDERDPSQRNPICSGMRDLFVSVRPSTSPPRHDVIRFRVEGEAVPNYTAYLPKSGE